MAKKKKFTVTVLKVTHSYFKIPVKALDADSAHDMVDVMMNDNTIAKKCRKKNENRREEDFAIYDVNESDTTAQ